MSTFTPGVPARNLKAQSDSRQLLLRIAKTVNEACLEAAAQNREAGDDKKGLTSRKEKGKKNKKQASPLISMSGCGICFLLSGSCCCHGDEWVRSTECLHHSDRNTQGYGRSVGERRYGDTEEGLQRIRAARVRMNERREWRREKNMGKQSDGRGGKE